jgi:hypothetical protein
MKTFILNSIEAIQEAETYKESLENKFNCVQVTSEPFSNKITIKGFNL